MLYYFAKLNNLPIIKKQSTARIIKDAFLLKKVGLFCKM
ncbi:MAG: hypothetical protein K0Q79_2857 [Flavipsychrobacter sp.]|jgi:hypothetical protein|nr:hypothetical protein [Flavipsychrobacter sp.]